MIPTKGTGHERLKDLLNSLIDFNAHAPQQPPPQDTPPTEHQHNQQHLQDPQATRISNMDNSPDPHHSTKTGKPSRGPGLSALITTVVSAIALIFSGYSFYETVLKQPSITLYPPALVHLYRQDFKDVLAFPVTLTNDGAQRGALLSFNMEVTNPATGEKKQFENLYFGNDPRDTSRIFTPITLPGRSSKGEVVMFFATKTGAFFETTGGVPLTLNIDLTLNLDRKDYWQPEKPPAKLSFTVSTGFIRSFRDMEQGKPTVLHLKASGENTPPAK